MSLSKPNGLDIIDLVPDAVGAILRATPKIMALCQNRIHDSIDPPAESMPFGVYEVEGNYTNTSPRDDVIGTITVRFWAQNKEDAMSCVAFAFEALNDQPLRIAGWSNYYCKARNWVRTQFYDNNTLVYVRGLTLEFRADRIN